jgi:hypothetical protein
MAWFSGAVNRQPDTLQGVVMADSYFIKRGATTKGPFSLLQLQEFLKAQQLKAADMISVDAEGPWVRFASVFYQVKQGIAPSLPDPPEVDIRDDDYVDAAREDDVRVDDVRIEHNYADDDYADANYSDANYSDKKHNKRRTHAEQATDFVDRTQKQLDKFGLGFLLNPRQFLDAEIYGFTDSDYPALAAAVRYYAYLAKLVFYILRIVIVIYAAIMSVLGSVGIILSAFSADSAIEMVTGPFIALVMLVVGLALVLLTTAMLLVLNNLGLILSLAGCEMIRVWVRTERNTRTLNN